MSRWKALPAELHPRVQQLVVRLRRLKDHSGLSMRQLAAKTGYSPKSWERYLAGRSLPPRDAVEAMARICGDDPVRVLALHEVAADVWEEGRGGAPASDTAAPEPGMFSAKAENARFSRRSPRVALVAGLVVLVLAIASVVLLVTHDKDGKATAASTASATQSQPTYTCHVERIDGRWYAGNSRTQDAILWDGKGGPEVAEAQCLLQRAGFSPGPVDGIVGPLTEDAVKRIQKRAGLIVDGIVGPQTWPALRG